MSVRLGVRRGQSQAQLDGFKSRALRAEAPTQRHLYTTAWRRMEVVGGPSAEVLVVGNDESVAHACWSLHPRHESRVASLHDGGWAALAVAMAAQCGSPAALPLAALEAVLVLVQAQASRTPAQQVWLLTSGAADHGASLGLSRSARAEASLPLVCIDAPAVTLALSVAVELTEPEAVRHERTPCVPRLKTSPPCLDGLAPITLGAWGTAT